MSAAACRPPLDLSLYLVTDSALCGAHGVVPTVTEAVAAGVSVVQLRDPACSDADFVTLGRALVRALADTGVPLIVNDRVHLLDAIGAAGAHSGQHDLDAGLARRLIGPTRWLGLSVQTLAHVVAARSLPPGTVDYLGVGPVWAQQTKPDAAPAGGLVRLAEIVQASAWPCVAIGGIDAARAALVRRAGAAGVAVVSAICGQPDVAAATQRLRAAWEGAPNAEPPSEG